MLTTLPPRFEAIEQVDLERPEHYFDVHPQGAIADIFQGQPALLRPELLQIDLLRIIAPLQPLALVADPQRRPGRDAGADAQDALLLLGEHRDVLGNLWPRPDDIHLALEDIDELWEFIEVKAANPFPYPCNSGIITRNRRATHLVCVRDHRPKFKASTRSLRDHTPGYILVP